MSDKLHVLCDMDGVLVDLLPTWLELYGRWTTDNVHPDRVVDYGYEQFVQRPDILLEVLPHALHQAAPMEGSSAIYQLVRDPRIELELVTYVHPCMPAERGAAIKRMWLNRWFPHLLDLVPIHFVGVERALMGADILIDDSPTNIEAYLKAEPNGWAHCVEHGYNQDWLDTRLANDRTTAVVSLSEAVMLIQFNLDYDDGEEAA